MAVTDRIAAVIENQYGNEASSVVSLLEDAELRTFHESAHERITAAVVILANGSLDGLVRAIDLMETDWRDLLVSAELDHSDWPSSVEEIFGSG
ncbi:hypothetical protein [Streptomyces sp. S.PB5]|uniref:hypothetical protein n=1 Tax=Streptomyces sp. S.PB5 TaxID=3020844 RepID=UPI0025AF3005|nr:hypothetical protein [Streptomyces sp. S.PB5]MDN3022679.1 hypothetical protein [Streptomyces sp. S.PB5]